ncbi:MAG: tetratricopeptide repeat protein [Parabacteroides sp.]|nr:tetratricopeptide repeat protein [Parabacteroides sp.]
MNRIVLFIAACLCLSGCSEGYYIREANRYCELGQLEKAIVYYDKALAKNPENYDVYIDKGLTYSDMAKEEEAVEIFSEAIKRVPGRAYAYYCRAESYMVMEKYEEALEDYNSTLKRVVGTGNELVRVKGVCNEFFHTTFFEPGDNIDPYTVYADRAVAYYYLDSLNLAWHDLNVCIGRSKELAQCYYWSAFIRFRSRDTLAACADLKKAVSLGYDGAFADYKKCGCDSIHP